MTQEASQQLRAVLGRFTRPGVPKYVALRDALVQAGSLRRSRRGQPAAQRGRTRGDAAFKPRYDPAALRALVDEGVIIRRQGQGTFVTDRGGGEMRTPLHCRFVDDSGTGYLPVYPEVTARYTEERHGPWTGHLGTQRALCIERILRIADEFKVFNRFYVDATRLAAFGTLPAKKLSGQNFKEIIWRESGLQIDRLAQFLSLVKPPQAICRAIGVRGGTSVTRLDSFGFSGKENPPALLPENYIPFNTRRLHVATDGRDAGLGRGLSASLGPRLSARGCRTGLSAG